MNGDDHYTYPGSGGVLVNRLDLHSIAELDTALNEFATIEWAALRREPLPDQFDFPQLQSIHRRLFGDVYPFAGEVRDVDVQAGGTGIAYCRPEFLADQTEFEFRRLENDGFLRGRDVHSFAEGLADHWGEITALHPFRDGNTRSQSAFVSMLANRAGFTIQWSQIDVDTLRSLRLEAVARSSTPLAEYLEPRLRPSTATSEEELQQLSFLVLSATTRSVPVSSVPFSKDEPHARPSRGKPFGKSAGGKRRRG